MPTIEIQRNRPRVIMLDEPQPHIDISNARRFGDIRVLFPQRAWRTSIWEDTFMPSLLERLDLIGYDPLFDYFLVAGSTASLALAIATIVGHYGRCKLLLFHAPLGQYVERTVGRKREVSISP